MDMLSALRLCRDTGVKVRPARWREAGYTNNWIEYRGVCPGGQFRQTGRFSESTSLRLTDEADLLGEWEVIE